MFDKCSRCKSIIWGYIIKNANKKFCSDCAICSECHLKLTSVYWFNNKGKFYCSECHTKQQEELHENLVKIIEGDEKKNEELKRKIEKLKEEINLPPCTKCRKKIRKGENYYYSEKNPENKTCVACHEQQLQQLEEERKKLEKEMKENKKIGETLDKISRKMENNKYIELSSEERKLLTPTQKENVDDWNRSLTKEERKKKDKTDKTELYFIVAFVIALVFLIIYYFNKKNEQKRKNGSLSS